MTFKTYGNGYFRYACGGGGTEAFYRYCSGTDSCSGPGTDSFLQSCRKNKAKCFNCLLLEDGNRTREVSMYDCVKDNKIVIRSGTFLYLGLEHDLF